MSPTHKSTANMIRNIFLDNYEDLCVYAYGFVRRKDIAEDIVQDVFFSFWRNRGKIDFSHQVRSLLFKYTRNGSLNYLKQKAIKNLSLDDDDGDKLEKFMIDILEAVPGNDELHYEHLRSQIDECVRSLPEQCRRVFEMSRFSGLKNKEIAESMGISIKAVEKHISAALSKMRNHLSKQGLLYILFILWML